MSTGMHSPDPILTASIYCNGRLDGVIHGAVAPVLEWLRRDDPAAPWLLWWVRYSKNGDHLKVRLHGPEPRREAARRLLADSVAAFFATLPPPDEGRPRISNPGIPSIDPEDDAAEDYPDRTLLWTRYRRSPVSFGPAHLLDDDAYAARFIACLGRGAELVLNTTSLGADGQIPGPARQRTLLKVLVAGIGAAAFDADERTEYLAYHRDWLLRFAVADSARETEALALFDRRIEGMQPTVDQLRRAMLAPWTPSPAGGDASEAAWRGAIDELCEYAAPFRHDPGYLSDPFTADASFPLVFKALHGVANQVGLNMLNEAFLHHMLLRAAEDAAPAASPALAEIGA